MAVHPLRDLVKVAERDLEDETKEREKVKTVELQSPGRNLQLSLSLTAVDHLQVKKTRRHAKTMF